MKETYSIMPPLKSLESLSIYMCRERKVTIYEGSEKVKLPPFQKKLNAISLTCLVFSFVNVNTGFSTSFSDLECWLKVGTVLTSSNQSDINIIKL